MSELADELFRQGEAAGNIDELAVFGEFCLNNLPAILAALREREEREERDDKIEGLTAALALLDEKLPGWEWSLERLDTGFTFKLGDPTLYLEGEAPTAPLAVLIAVLKALDNGHG